MERTTMDRPIPSGGAAASTPATPQDEPRPAVSQIKLTPTGGTIILSREALFGAQPIKAVEVDVPGYGTVRIASLTQGQWEDLNNRHEGEDGKTNTSKGYMSEAVAAALVNPDGTYMFEDHAEGGKQVRTLALPAVSKMFEAVATQSGLTQEARENLGKDSAPIPSAGA